MAEVMIRDAVPADAEALAELNKNEMGYEYPVGKTRDKVAALAGDKILVVKGSV